VLFEAALRILGALLDAVVHGLASWVAFTSTGCRAWPTLRSEPQLAKQRYGLPAHSSAPTRQTAEPPSRASSTQIP
jgi:hypothetical protein